MIRLSVSNLAWPSELDSTAFEQMAAAGVTGIEVAPTRLAPWNQLDARRLAAYRARLASSGLCVTSLQAVLFGRPELQLLAAEPNQLEEHMRLVSQIAALLGAGVLVLGAPRNRLRGDMAVGDAMTLAVDRLQVLADIVADAGAILGIEPVPAIYGGDFLQSWSDVVDIVQRVDHPAVRVHLDSGCVSLNGDSITEAIERAAPLLVHFHAAQPQLGPFEPAADYHQPAAISLAAAGYQGWLAIEMREQSPDPLQHVTIAIREVTRIYGQVASCPSAA